MMLYLKCNMFFEDLGGELLQLLLGRLSARPPLPILTLDIDGESEPCMHDGGG